MRPQYQSYAQLFEEYIGVCDGAIRSRLGYRNPANLVRSVLMLFVDEVVLKRGAYIEWNRTVELIDTCTAKEIHGAQFLDELRREGLVIVARDPHAIDERWIVRFAFQRYFDVLRALKMLNDCIDLSGCLNYASLATSLAAGTPEDAGLIEAIAAALPEKFDCEITESDLRLDRASAHKAFIRSLPWRSRKSISVITRYSFESSMSIPGLWQQALETLLRISLVPRHRLNADFLHAFLEREPLAERDPYWAFVLYSSYSENGVVRSIIQAALHADLGRWPAESLGLAATVLAWFCSAADRRVRDKASKALTRLVRAKPALGAPLVERFSTIDDDYVKERILQTIYSSLLLDNSPERKPYLNALCCALKRGYDSRNVLLRDTVRLIAIVLGPKAFDKKLKQELKRFPTRCTSLTSWPTAADVKPLTDVEHLPNNMKLVGNLRPDFARYIVEPELRSFELKAAGITLENVLYWIMAEALNLGYPGRDDRCIAYDRQIINDFGPGRGRRGFAERLGKKYYWIALHRLIGLLADTVPAVKDYDGRIPAAGHLWSRELREIDLTDFRDLDPSPPYPEGFLDGIGYSFGGQPADDRTWMERNELSAHDAYLLRRDKQNVEWVVCELSYSASDRAFDDDIMSGSHRSFSLYYSSVFVDLQFTFLGGLAGCHQIDESMELQGNKDYRGYLAEYPCSRVFMQARNGGSLFTSYETDSMSFVASHVELLRGANWKYDHSSEDEHPNLIVPGRDFVDRLKLRWDQHSGWVAESGMLMAVWLEGNSCKGLFVRREALDEYLKATDQHVLIRRFVCKSRHEGSESGVQSDSFSYLRYDGALTVLHEVKRVYPEG